MFSFRKRDTAATEITGKAGTGTAASLHRLYPIREHAASETSALRKYRARAGCRISSCNPATSIVTLTVHVIEMGESQIGR